MKLLMTLQENFLLDAYKIKYTLLVYKNGQKSKNVIRTNPSLKEKKSQWYNASSYILLDSVSVGLKKTLLIIENFFTAVSKIITISLPVIKNWLRTNSVMIVSKVHPASACR